MKKIYAYGIGFFLIAILFTACYYFSYQSALGRFKTQLDNKENQMLQKEENVKKENTKDDEGETLSVDASKITKILPTTKYIVESYDVAANKTIEEEVAIPDYLVGATRETLIEYLNNYLIELPLEEYQKGLLSYELLSFSNDKVVTKKTYNSSMIYYKYFIAVEDGDVVVYYSDKKTVYEYTGIDSSQLPEEEQIKLNEGINVKDEDELYGILENYSS